MEKIRCPYLGLKGDPDTHHSGASLWNCCYNTKIIESIDEAFQEDYCLTSNHTNCPVYKMDKCNRLPANLRSSEQPTPTRSWMSVLVVVLLIAGVCAAIYFLTGGMNFQQAIGGLLPKTETPVPTFTQRPTDTPTPEATATAPVTFMETLLAPLPTNTSTLTLTPTLTPVGSEVIIYKVKEGDVMELVARRYQTTIEAILEVNYRVDQIWPGLEVAIPVGRVNASRLPSFDIIQAREDGLAKNQAIWNGADIDLFCFYNKVSPDDVIRLGTSILIPHRPGEKMPTPDMTIINMTLTPASK